jgi:hypothetical protein
MPTEEPVHTLVIGDVNVDVVIAPVPRVATPPLNWLQEAQYREFRRAGGAWLVHEIIAASTGDKECVHTYDRSVGDHWCELVKPPCPVSIASIRPYVRHPKDRPERRVYRMDQALLGWMRPWKKDVARAAEDHDRELLGLLGTLTPGARTLPELVVVHDHNNGFRSIDPGESLHPVVARNPHFAPAGEGAPPQRGMFLWHTDSPLCRGGVWEYLSTHHADRTIAVVNVEDLREHGIFLKEDLSLEQTAYDFLYQLRHSPLSDLTKLWCVVVRFTNGAMVYSRTGLAKDGESLFLSFLPHGHRGGSKQSSDLGIIVGYTLLLVGALAQGIGWALSRARGRSHEEWLAALVQGIRRGTELGIAYGQMHFREGFLPADFEALDTGGAPHPYTALVANFAARIEQNPRYKDELRLSALDFDVDRLRTDPTWSRVSVLGSEAEVLAKAVEIVRQGLVKVLEYQAPEDPGTPWNALRERLHFPYFRAGDLYLVDRREVDSFESLSTLVRNYLRTKSAKEPLSIAVFGPPGSGKSFSVKQLLRKAQHAKAEDVDLLTFNLAQFQDLGDLSKAFHAVQDKGLGGDVPFVLFDEFDSFHGSELGWLKYFLAPMQDGTFKDGETIYQIGRAIFFFAGGTHDDFGEFYKPEPQDDGDDSGKEAYESRKEAYEVFRHAKGPDFVSRLRGYLDISGINAEVVDDMTIIRRAILLRAFIKRNCANIVDPVTDVAKIDPAVVRALLQTKRYEHGSRSMEAVVKMAAISTSRGSFQPASMPLDSQLRMHMDAEEFLVRIENRTEEGDGAARQGP